MRLRALTELVVRDLRRSVRTFSVAALGITVGIATLAFFLALSAGMRAVVLGRIFPVNRVEVIPPETAVGSVLSLLGTAPAGIDPGSLATLRRTPGVVGVLPRMRLDFPSSGRGGRAVFGRDVGAGEIPADGVDPALVLPDLPPGTFFGDPDPRSSHRPCASTNDCPTGEYCQLDVLPSPVQPRPRGTCGEPIPAVVSPYLVEVFNGAIAPAHHLPRLGAFILHRAEGLVLEWDLGRAGLGSARQGTPRRVYARIVGISPRAIDLGITVPMDVARRLNREYAGGDSAEEYSSVVVYLRSPDALTPVSAVIRAAGLEIRTSGAEQMGLLVTAITAILSLTSVVTIVVASINIAHVFSALIAERRGEIGLMRALGATRSDIRRIVLAQAFVLGATASLVGIVLARISAAGVNRFASGHLPDFPFKPDDWFLFTTRSLGLTVAFGVGACVLSAIAPAIRAARVEPASALASGV